jgi:hypothetical protein
MNSPLNRANCMLPVCLQQFTTFIVYITALMKSNAPTCPCRAIARFLFLNISFDTQLLVWEDDIARTIKFQNAQEGFMKKVGSGIS